MNIREKLSAKQIEVAVAWWAAVLGGTKTFQKHIEADAEENGRLENFMAEAIATVEASKVEVSDEAIAKFSAKLAEILATDKFFVPEGLYVDYRPCLELGEAIKAAGLNPDRPLLPWKTTMMFWDGGVIASGDSGGRQLL